MAAVEVKGRHFARVMPKRDGMWVVVQRQNPDLSSGCYTYHFTRRGARRAAEVFRRSGLTIGFCP